MSTAFADIERMAFDLPENQRARLADSLLRSLSEYLIDDDEVAEAIRRDREMDADPRSGISLEELDRSVRTRFPGLPA
ncbi:MAG: addiction module protein [Blastocatellia bacterium]|nr:addiction module protein [Blastocatellia bacterium]